MRIVLLHGWLMSPDIWDGVRRALPSSWDIVAPSQPGHGDEAPLADPSMAGWRDWLVARTGGERNLLLVGHSMGGMLALSMLRHRPELVAGVVAVASTATAWSTEQVAGWHAMVGAASPGWPPEMAQALGGILYGPRYLAANPQVIARWHESWRDRGDLAAAAQLRDVIATREDLTTTPAPLRPAAVLRGDEDPAITAAEAVATAVWLGTSVVAVPAAGHCLPLEAADAVARAIAGVAAQADRDGLAGR
jgi:pimeloyl-ACP methyl ester carboxylesterase